MGYSASATVCYGQVVQDIDEGELDFDDFEERLEGAQFLGYDIFGYLDGQEGYILLVKGTATNVIDYGWKPLPPTITSPLLASAAVREARERGWPDFKPEWIVAANYG